MTLVQSGHAPLHLPTPLPPDAKLNRAQRRALTKSPEGRLSESAFGILRENLENFGNVLSEDHAVALMRIIGCFSYLATGRAQERYAYGLGCGLGKTEAIVAWCTALHRLKRPYSVAVAASKVEALCDLKRRLIECGVPENRIGLRHSYKHDANLADAARRGDEEAKGYASFPSDEEAASGRQILLVTHTRLRNREHLRQLRYRGKERSLVIWDESLIVSDHRYITRTDIAKALGWLKPDIDAQRQRGDDTDKCHAFDYLSRCLQLVDAEIKAQSDRSPQTIKLPEIDEGTATKYQKALGHGWTLRALRHLLDLRALPLRAVKVNQGGGGLVYYDIAVPRELRRVAVLDASFPIRKLEQLDKTLRKDAAFNGAVKTYRNVTIHQLRSSSGRGGMEADFRQKKEDRLVSKEIVAVTKSLPADEAIIIWTFKRRDGSKVDMADTLRRDLRAAGVDTDATIDTPDGPKPRLALPTWGQETSTSEFVHAKHVIFAGVLHRDEVDLAGAIIGQLDNITADVPQGLVNEVRRSEVCHALYQAINRAACRVTVNGEAAPTNVWLIHRDKDVRPLLDEVMPDLQWKLWVPQFLKGIATVKADFAAEDIRGYLEGLSRDTVKVSLRALKAATGLGDLSNKAFQSARDEALQGLKGWRLEGRSLVRSWRPT